MTNTGPCPITSPNELIVLLKALRSRIDLNKTDIGAQVVPVNITIGDIGTINESIGQLQRLAERDAVKARQWFDMFAEILEPALLSPRSILDMRDEQLRFGWFGEGSHYDRVFMQAAYHTEMIARKDVEIEALRKNQIPTGWICHP